VVLDIHDRTRMLELARFGHVGHHGSIPSGQITSFLIRLSYERIASTLAMEGFDLDPTQRPFVFLVPLKNVRWTAPGPNKLMLGDMFITCDDPTGARNVFGIRDDDLERMCATSPEWRTDVPKVCGVVQASDFYEARQAAIRRARVALDLLHAACRLGQGWVDVQGTRTVLSWDLAQSLTRPALTDSVALRDLSHSQPGSLIIEAEPNPRPSNVVLDLGQCAPQLAAVQPLLRPVAESGGMTQKHQDLSATRLRALHGAQRALRWLTNGREQALPADALLSYWFALETLLKTHDYPNILDGPNQEVADALKALLCDLPIPRETSITREYFMNKLLSGDLPLRAKLTILVERLNVTLSAEDQEVVRRLGRLRARLVHSGTTEQPSPQALRHLENLVERLALAVAGAE
jgi:hypothetical protein